MILPLTVLIATAQCAGLSAHGSHWMKETHPLCETASSAANPCRMSRLRKPCVKRHATIGRVIDHIPNSFWRTAGESSENNGDGLDVDHVVKAGSQRIVFVTVGSQKYALEYVSIRKRLATTDLTVLYYDSRMSAMLTHVTSMQLPLD